MQLQKELTPRALAKCVDQTLLKQFKSEQEYKEFCALCRKYEFAMAAVNPATTALCKKELEGSGVHVGAAVGFPLGQTTLATKVFETEDAIREGADEIDYVVNIVKIKSGDWLYVREEMHNIVAVCRKYGKIVKVIMENCFLTREEKIKLCELALEERPDFLKTSTGYFEGGATIEDIRLMKSVVGDAVALKAAKFSHRLQDALAFIYEGVTRLGTSAGPQFVDEYTALYTQRFGPVSE